jgi:hypothetical protein
MNKLNKARKILIWIFSLTLLSLLILTSCSKAARSIAGIYVEKTVGHKLVINRDGTYEYQESSYIPALLKGEYELKGNLLILYTGKRGISIPDMILEIQGDSLVYVLNPNIVYVKQK